MKKFILGSIIGTLTISSICFANVQSRPDRTRLIYRTVNQFFLDCRFMEAEGGVLGKSATISESTGIESSSSNGIDAHMVKNTEYGAAAILSVSQYGYQEQAPVTMGNYNSSDNTYRLGSSTTGAANTESYYYGLFDMGNNSRYTYTASMYKNPTNTADANRPIFYDAVNTSSANYSALKKYVDSYPGPVSDSNGNYYYGDATSETHLWRGASWGLYVSYNNPIFFRDGGIFSTNIRSGDGRNGGTSRAVVVCGTGL